MCTVSYIRTENSIIFTSNRDEHISRPTAYLPREEVIKGTKVLFPKDPRAGGTWFAVNDKHVVSVLLNGAFKKHRSNGNYVRSRGLVMLDVIGSDRPRDTLLSMDLDRIEPFTIVLYQDRQLFEFRWDSSQRYFKELDSETGTIWSSTTLYSEEVILARERLFKEFLAQNTCLNEEKALSFHSNDYNDKNNGFIIERENGLKTFSITQAVLSEDLAKLRHIDLQNKNDHTLELIKQHPMGQI